MKSPKIPIALEGYPFIFSFVFITLVLAVTSCFWATFISLLATLFTLYFFRDPERFIPEKEHVIVSPADGKIIGVEKVLNQQQFENEVYKISIFMNVFNVHVNRLPVSGTVEKIEYQPGKFYSADTDKAAEYNEHCATTINCKNNVNIVFIQIAGLIARRIVNWLEPGDTVKKGDRFGLIRFGSRVDLYVPSDASIAVEKGQKVRAGESILGYLNIP